MLIDGTSILDQAVAVVEQDKYEEASVMNTADAFLSRSLKDGDFGWAWGAVKKLRAMNKASSLGICRILHGVKSNFDKVPCEDGDSFESQAVRETGYARETIDRYVFVWEFLNGDYIPEQFKENIWGQTMRQLVKEAETVVDQRYELEDDDWLALSEAGDYHRTMEVCQAAKGKPRNKNHMSLKIDDEGDVWVYQGGNEGFLFSLPIRDQREFMQKACRRVVRELGITKKNEY